jgi:hypothetical protein
VQYRQPSSRCTSSEQYNIVSEADLADAARKLDAFAGTITGTTGN